MIIELSVGKSNYKISCQESEKEKLFDLADSLNERVNQLALSLKNADEKTLLLVTALMLEEELTHKEPSAAPVEEEEEHEESPKLNEQDMFDSVSENMENIADYIDKLTVKIQNY